MWTRTVSRPSAAAMVARRRGGPQLQQPLALRCHRLLSLTALPSAARHLSHYSPRAAHAYPPRAFLSPVSVSRRSQSSLQKLLDDPNDPYLAALQDFDIPRIAAIVAAGPATSGVPAVFLQRIGLRTDNDVAAATRAQHAAPTPLTRRPASSSAEAVLQSLHATGAARQRAEAAAAAADRQSAQEAYDALSDEEKAALQRERAVAHLFDGLCAVAAAARVLVGGEGEAATAEELEAVAAVVARVVEARRSGLITQQRWEDDFAGEVAELRMLWEHLGASKPLPLENA